MATGNRWDQVAEAASLELEKDNPDCVTVFYVSERNKARDTWKQILRIDRTQDHLTIYPLVTWSGNTHYLEGKYLSIESIVFVGFGFEVPQNGEEAAEILSELPAGFIKDYRFGLGLKREYKIIIEAIEENPELKHLVINKTKTAMEGETYFLKEKDYHDLRKSIDRTSNAHQRDARKAKQILTHNALLTGIDPENFPVKEVEYSPGTIVKFISNKTAQTSLSPQDRKASLELVRKNAAELVKTEKKELLRLKEDIELVTLQELIKKFETMLGQKLTENKWQTFFQDNPFVLSLAFGYPVIQIGGQISVGGLSLTGRGVKITDFLVKSAATNNLVVIEIKKPSTKLFSNKPYRDNIYSSSSELSGSINQVLDQKYQLQKNISPLKVDSEMPDIEAYSVHGILIIGTMPAEKAAKKTFELLRSASKDVLVVTFDELLGKLKSILEYVGTSSEASASIEE